LFALIGEEMANKVTDYIKNYGKNNIKYLLLGNTSSTFSSDSLDAHKTAWKDAEISYRVTKNNIIGVVKNNTWNRSSYYTPWKPNLASTVTNFYVYIPETGIVYLCISDNPYNRDDLSGDFVSTIKPTHQYGIRRYDDGYAWMPLYKITQDLVKFVTSSWIPVISFDNLDIDGNQTNQYRRSVQFCGSYSTNESGNCGIYFKSATRIPTSDSTFSSYESGQLFKQITMTCNECFWLFQGEDDNYISAFYGSDLADSTIDVENKLDEIERLIGEGTISINSPYKYLYDYYMNNEVEDGGVVWASINLINRTQAELEVRVENPTLTVQSMSGSGAEIRLTTFVNGSGNYQINGIEILNHGSGYYDYKLGIDSSVLTGINEETLISLIDIKLDAPDNIGLDPLTILGCSNLMTNVTISSQELIDNGIRVPDTVNFYALFDNPQQNINGVNYLAGQSTNTPYSKSINARYTQYYISALTPGAAKTKLDTKSNWSNVDQISGSKIQRVTIKDVIHAPPFASTRTVIRVTGDVKTEATGVSKLTITGTDYTINKATTVVVPSETVQFSGRLNKAAVFNRRSLSSYSDGSTNIGIGLRIVTPI